MKLWDHKWVLIAVGASIYKTLRKIVIRKCVSCQSSVLNNADLCFRCHVKTVTGVSPQAKTLYHCLSFDLSVSIYCLWHKEGTP